MSRRPRVLVIDDSELVLDWTRMVLECAGIEVVTHAQSLGAGAVALRAQPDLVLLDVNMPALRGEELLEIFRRHAELRGTPVLLHSDTEAHALADITERCHANGCIRKTDDPDVFLDAIRPWLDSTAQREAGRQPLFVEDDTRLLALYERAFAKSLGGDYVTTVEEAIEHIESTSPPSVVVADVVLGDKSALYVYERAVARDPSWSRRFVFVTGRPFSGAVTELLEGLDAPVLYKPVDTERLRDLVEQMAQAPMGA